MKRTFALLINLILTAVILASPSAVAYGASTPVAGEDSPWVGPGFTIDVLASDALGDPSRQAPDGIDVGMLVLERIALEPGASDEKSDSMMEWNAADLLFVESGSVTVEHEGSSKELIAGDQQIHRGPEPFTLTNSGDVCAYVLRLSIQKPSGRAGAFSSGVSGPQIPGPGCGESRYLVSWITGPVLPPDAVVFIARVSMHSWESSWTRVHAGPTVLLIETGTMSTYADGSEFFLGADAVVLTKGGQSMSLQGRGESQALMVGVSAISDPSGITGTSYISENTYLALGWPDTFKVDDVYSSTNYDTIDLLSSNGILSIENARVDYDYDGASPAFPLDECLNTAWESLESNPSVSQLQVSRTSLGTAFLPALPHHEALTIEFQYEGSGEPSAAETWIHHVECGSADLNSSISRLSLTSTTSDLQAFLREVELISLSTP